MDQFDWQDFFLDAPEIASGHAKEAKFSIFDDPEEVEKAVAAEEAKEPEKAKEPEEAEGKWQQFLELFYEGGKKKVKNPNPKTKSMWPEVQVSTALNDQSFASKIKKEYEAWLAQGEPKPGEAEAKPAPEEKKEPEKKPEPEKPKVGDKVTSTEQLEAGMFIQNAQGVTGRILGKTPDGGFRYERWLPTGWAEPQVIGKQYADDFFKKESFTVVEDPAKLVPEGAEPTSIEDIAAGDYVWFNGARRKVKKVGPDPHKFGRRVQLEDGTWVNQTYLDTVPGVTNGSHVYVEKGKPEKEPEKKPEGKAEVGDEVTTSDQLEAGDWIETADPDDPDTPYVGKIVELVSSGVMIQDFSPATGKLIGKPWLLKEEDLAKTPAKKIEEPKKIKKPLAGKPVTDPKKLKEHDVLRIHDYATGKTFTAQVGYTVDGILGLKIVNPKTGKVKEALVIDPKDFENYQVHRLPKSKVPKALQPPEEGEPKDPFQLIYDEDLEKKVKEKAGEEPKEPEKPKEEAKAPEKPEEPEEKKPAGKTKTVDAGKWKLQTEHVTFDEIKAGDVVHTEFGPQRVVERTGSGVRLDSGVVVPKSKLKKEKSKYVVSRGDKPQKATPPKMPERPSGQPVTKADQVKEGDVIEYEHNGVTYRGEVVSWDVPGEKFRVKIIYPPEKLDKYQSYDEATGEIKYKTPSFDFEKIKKRKPRILTKEEMKEYDTEVKKYTEKIKEIDKRYAEDVAEYQAAMAGQKEVTTGPLKHLQPPKDWNHDSTIARDADRFFEQYKEFLGPKVKEIVDDMASGKSYWHGQPAMWEEMSEGERKLAQSAHLAAAEFNKLLTPEERDAWQGALSAWQGSSGATTAHKLMGGLENLGVEGGPKYFETANVQHYREEGRKNEALHRAIAKAMAYSQLVYQTLGLDHVTLYRGTRTKPVKGAPQGKKIKTTTARELASFSIDPQVAYSFGERAVRYRVPVSRLFVSPVTYASLSSAKQPYSENEYVVAGQDGMEGKVMPTSMYDFDADKMKLASMEDLDEVLIVEFSAEDDDWLRPGVIETWWDEKLFRPQVAASLLRLAREHAGFRREMLAVLRPRRASFSIFDDPDEITKSVSQESSGSPKDAGFEEWFRKRYDGGKKRVPNPNPKTKDRYPEVATSTAMRDRGFAAKVYAEYQQEKAQQQPQGQTPQGKITQPSDVKKGDAFRYEFKGKTYVGVVTEAGEDKFWAKVYDPKTGEPLSQKERSFDAEKIKERKVERAEKPKQPELSDKEKGKKIKSLADLKKKGDLVTITFKDGSYKRYGVFDRGPGYVMLAPAGAAGGLVKLREKDLQKYDLRVRSKQQQEKEKKQKEDEDKPEKPVKEQIHEWSDRLKTLMERIKEGASAAEKDAKEFKDELGQYLVDNYKKLSPDEFARVQKMMAGIDLAMIGGAMGEMTKSNAQVKKTVAEWSDKIDAAREAKDPKKLRKVVEDAVAFLNERLDPKKFNQTLFKGLFDKLQAIDPSEIEETQASEAKKEPEAKPEEKAEAKHLDIDAGGFTQIGPQTGSNPGGLYEAEDGTRYYVKTPKTEDRARNEILAGKLYELAGIDVPELVPATREGKFSVASRIIPGLKRNKSKLTQGGVPGVAEGIAVDAWLANWDVVGLEHDNLLVDEEGHGKRVDTGGALRYRAMGEPKGDKFGPEVSELEVFTDRSRRAGGVLGHATPKQIVESIDRILDIPETKIRALVRDWGPKDDKERDKLLETLLARRESLKKQREKYAEKAKTASRIARLALADPTFRRRLLAEAARLRP